MEAEYEVKKPDNIDFTMKITMELKDWVALHGELDKVDYSNNYQLAKLKETIQELAMGASKQFYKRINK